MADESMFDQQLKSSSTGQAREHASVTANADRISPDKPVDPAKHRTPTRSASRALFPDKADAVTQQHGGTAAHLAAAAEPQRFVSACAAGRAVRLGLGAAVVEQYDWDWVKLVADLLSFDRWNLADCPPGGLALQAVPEGWSFPARIEVNSQEVVVMYPTPAHAQQACNSMAAALSLQAENEGLMVDLDVPVSPSLHELLQQDMPTSVQQPWRGNEQHLC